LLPSRNDTHTHTNATVGQPVREARAFTEVSPRHEIARAALQRVSFTEADRSPVVDVSIQTDNDSLDKGLDYETVFPTSHVPVAFLHTDTPTGLEDARFTKHASVLVARAHDSTARRREVGDCPPKTRSYTHLTGPPGLRDLLSSHSYRTR
jgi:hypothetical protein